MSMSRKTYEQVARGLRDRNIPWSARVEAANVMADVFADDNERFDRGRFLEACGVEFPPCLVCGEPGGHLPGCALEQSMEVHPAGKGA